MAEIQLIIDAEDAADLKLTIEELAGYEIGEGKVEHPGATATEDAEPGERQRRKRRTKAEIEAATTGGAPSEATSSETLPTADSDPFHTSSLSSSASITMVDIQAAARQKAMPPGSMKAVQDLLEQNFKDTEGLPVRQLSKLQTADYFKVLELLAV